MIFFDVDETLLDFKASEYLGVKALFEMYCTHFDHNESAFYFQWCEIGKRHFTRYLSGELTFEEQKIARVKALFGLVGLKLNDTEALAIFNVYLTHFQDNWRPFDDVIPCLKELEGLRLGVISNGDFDQQNSKLIKMGIRDCFELVVTAGDVGVAKPDVAIFQTACGRADVSPDNCVYIGDNYVSDILPCAQIGMKGIWLNRKGIMEHRSEDVLQIQNLSELASYLSCYYP
ncbi:HAD family hydrolase [Alicyclobacillus fodiniaquatilis]|uniref:HAD family hydrolase n=1 Tax=Alicyclobacillus fodiniaquatilis TaxID=1661150 RepID=A0ABW4JBU7_9BACL